MFQISSPAFGCYTVTRDGIAVYTTVSLRDAQAWVRRHAKEVQ